MKVAEVMTSYVEFIAPDRTVQEAATAMGELDVGALPIGNAAELTGIVTDRDVLFRCVAEGRDPARTRIEEIATRRVFTCRSDDNLAAALDLMAAHGIRRLPVLDDDDEVVGWLTLSDVSRRLMVDSEVVQQALRALPGRLEGKKEKDGKDAADAHDDAGAGTRAVTPAEPSTAQPKPTS